MLRTDLIDIINRGDAWAFIGSGCSVDAGGPSWADLVSKVVDRLDTPLREAVFDDQKFQQAFAKKQFSTCFSRSQRHAGRPVIQETVAMEMNKMVAVGHLTKVLVQLPFKGYITTNYDDLLERALLALNEHGWLPIGNTEKEVRKVAGDPSKVIWHIHGSTGMPDTKSRLILTDEDYDEMYLEDSSPAFMQLRGLLGHRRLVFIGFGFEDVEILRLLKKVGRLSNPARPVYAFLSGLVGARHTEQRKDLLDKYNIDTVPYKVVDGSHHKLIDLLKAHASLILPRSLRFNRTPQPCPSYYPETTGLLIYNELCLKNGAMPSKDILGTLLRARILSLLKHKGPCKMLDLIEDLNIRIRSLDRTPGGDESISTTQSAISGLLELGYIDVQDVNGSSIVKLTKAGNTVTEDRAATSERLAEQFSASLLSRSSAILPDAQDAASRVALAAESFLKQCVERRALGVAMIRHATKDEFASYHMVALMQALPGFMSQLQTTEEAIALSRLVQEVLSSPSEAETQYIGLSLQAQFGVHLLGYDLDTLTVRADELRGTLFLVDSTTLIPFLAKSSVGYDFARILITRLQSMNSIVATTTLLSQEVAEHARYALKKIEEGGGRLNVDTLKALTGRAGERSNAFLEGFTEELQKGTVANFSHYICQICAVPRGSISCSDEDISRAVKTNGIYCYSLEEWEGFLPELWSERDELQKNIAQLRTERKTFKHDRQVKAEAEALIIIKNFRKKLFSIKDHPVSNSYFVSHTRVIDEVAGPGFSVTMRPEAVLQWITTINPCTLEELQLLTANLLTELSERNCDIIDKNKLYNVFAPLISASKEKLEEELEHHRALISNRYGEKAVSAFHETSSLHMPIVLESYYAQKTEFLTKELQKEKIRTVTMKAATELTEKERNELTRLRTEKRLKQTKAARKKKHSNPKKKKKKNKR